jgi:hypothetical protein
MDDDDDEGRRRSAGLVAVPSFKPPDRVWGASERVKTTPKKRLVWLAFSFVFHPHFTFFAKTEKSRHSTGATLQRKTEREWRTSEGDTTTRRRRRTTRNRIRSCFFKINTRLRRIASRRVSFIPIIIPFVVLKTSVNVVLGARISKNERVVD